MAYHIHRAAAALALPALAALLLSGSAEARTLQVGQGRQYDAPSAAADAARDGDTVSIAPGEYFDCAVWKASNLTIQGEGRADQVVITDKTCQGKGLFVTTGTNTTVRNLTLTRARVADGNGAGIRVEGKDLTVDGVRFVNNQNGILAGAIDGATIIVRNSEFVRNGTCENSSGCAHGIYIGFMTRLRVENSRFFDTREGHHIKSRASFNEIIGNDIEDGPNGTASYEIDISNGGKVLIQGNTLQKGPKSENRTAAIMVGSEGVLLRTPEILIENNTFTNQAPTQTTLLTNRTATEAIVRNNRLIGDIRPLQGDGTVTPAR